MVRVEVPLLVRVTFMGTLLVPTVCEGKLSDGGEKLTAVAVPVRVTDTVALRKLLSVTTSVAERVPPPVGAKDTETVQVLPLARTPRGQLSVSVKSAEFVPLKATLLIFRSYPVAVSTTGCDELVVPTACKLKVRLVVGEANSETGVTSSTW
jgi:hypothetical protein